MNSPAVEKRINAIRFLSVDTVQKANSGHPGFPLGAAATAFTLWSRHLKFNPPIRNGPIAIASCSPRATARRFSMRCSI